MNITVLFNFILEAKKICVYLQANNIIADYG